MKIQKTCICLSLIELTGANTIVKRTPEDLSPEKPNSIVNAIVKRTPEVSSPVNAKTVVKRTPEASGPQNSNTGTHKKVLKIFLRFLFFVNPIS